MPPGPSVTRRTNDLTKGPDTLAGPKAVADLAMHPGRRAHLLFNGTDAGAVGELHPATRGALGLPDQPVVIMELDLEALLAGWGTVAPPMVGISGQPAVYEDLALIVDEGVPADQVATLIRQAGGKTLVSLRLFDVYSGQPIPPGKKSLAYALTFQAPDRTLTDEDVHKQRSKILSRLERELSATPHVERRDRWTPDRGNRAGTARRMRSRALRPDIPASSVPRSVRAIGPSCPRQPHDPTGAHPGGQPFAPKCLSMLECSAILAPCPSP